MQLKTRRQLASILLKGQIMASNLSSILKNLSSSCSHNNLTLTVRYGPVTKPTNSQLLELWTWLILSMSCQNLLITPPIRSPDTLISLKTLDPNLTPILVADSTEARTASKIGQQVQHSIFRASQLHKMFWNQVESPWMLLSSWITLIRNKTQASWSQASRYRSSLMEKAWIVSRRMLTHITVIATILTSSKTKTYLPIKDRQTPSRLRRRQYVYLQLVRKAWRALFVVAKEPLLM